VLGASISRSQPGVPRDGLIVGMWPGMSSSNTSLSASRHLVGPDSAKWFRYHEGAAVGTTQGSTPVISTAAFSTDLAIKVEFLHYQPLFNDLLGFQSNPGVCLPRPQCHFRKRNDVAQQHHHEREWN